MSGPAQVANSPVFNDTQFTNNDGTPLSGGLIYTYIAGSSSTQQETYATAAGDVTNSNPIVLDSAGRMTTGLWLIDGNAYNLVLTQPDGTTVLSSYDNILGVMPVPPGGGLSTALWIPASVVPAYVSASSFNLTGNYVSQFSPSTRIRYQFSDNSYAYGTITVVTFADPITQVTFRADNTGFNSDAINVAYSAAGSPNYVVDAGATSYTGADIAYDPKTVGGMIQDLQLRISSAAKLYTVLDSPTYTLTTDWPVTNLAQATYNVKFGGNATTSASLNINNIGATNLMQLDSSGNKIAASIVPNLISELIYDGTDLIVMNPVPVVATGTIIWFGSSDVPGGWLVCDGTAIDSTLYPALISIVGANLPNLLGQFIRGFDTSGAIDPGRVFGSTQMAAMASHVHGVGSEGGDNGGFFTISGHSYNTENTPNYINWNGAGHGIGGGGTSNPMSMNLGTTSEFVYGSNDTRPTNVALLPCIKT